MRADWQEVPRSGRKAEFAGIYVTMDPKGKIIMSHATYQMLGGPEAFVILFDKVNSRIGLKPATLATRNAYPAQCKGSAGAKLVRGYRMMCEHRIDLAQTVRFYDADIDEDGILVLDLRTAKVSPRAANHYRNREKRQM